MKTRTMYDLRWAGSVFYRFRETHARADNLVRVIQQLLMETGINLSVADIQASLLASIAIPSHKRLWTEFKRWVKKPAIYDSDRLRAEIAKNSKYLYRCVDESHQKFLDYDS